MLHELKRTFNKGVISLSDAPLAKDTAVYAGETLNTVRASAGYLDWEKENQHFPAENTIEIFGMEKATSALNGASLHVSIQSSEDASTWKTEYEFDLEQADIVGDTTLLKRMSIPAKASRYMQAVLTVEGEVFTAGSIFMTVSHL